MTFIHPVEMFFIIIFEWMFIGISRLFERFMVLFSSKIYTKDINRIMVVGAGLAGEMLVKELNKKRRNEDRVVLFVDDNNEKIGKRLLDIKIEGPSSNIATLIEKHSIDEVVVAIADIPLKKLSQLLESISKTNTPVKRVPTLKEIKSGEKFELQPVQITDLLNRDEIELDNQALESLIKNKTVLITGGGGSIGSELTRQIVKLDPKEVIIFDIYENTAYEVQTELMHAFSKLDKRLNLKVIIGSIYNQDRLENLFKSYSIELIFHAAAYKHVPLMEDSPVEAIRTNVLGTYYLSECAIKYQVERMVLVSSDKAVRPTNIMGATKRLAEKIIQTAQKKTSQTIFSAVRFGNVLDSHGSVIPLFKKQIESGGPITVTDKKMTRYFMTIPEAVSLILQASTYASNGEIFVLDMGEPVKIIDLAEKMIRLSGFKPYTDIDIKFIGLRDGEKLYEELIIDETMEKTHNKKILIDPTYTVLDNHWLEQINDIDTLSKELIIKILTDFQLEYKNASLN
jgi:FlaA1/EpsC-like NDP-sugar epimerase